MVYNKLVEAKEFYKISEALKSEFGDPLKKVAEELKQEKPKKAKKVE